MFSIEVSTETGIPMGIQREISCQWDFHVISMGIEVNFRFLLGMGLEMGIVAWKWEWLMFCV